MELRPYQLNWVSKILNAFMEHDRVLGCASTGSGKCWSPGTQLLMYDGTTKAVEDVVIGDRLMGADSKPRAVLGLGSGWDTMYRITLKDGTTHVCNSSHILVLRVTGTGPGKGRCATAPDGRKYYSGEEVTLTVTDYLRASKTFKHCVKWVRSAVHYDGGHDLRITPYLLGAWLGDGTSVHAAISKPGYSEIIADEAARSGWNVIERTYGDKCPTIAINGGFRVALINEGLLGNKHIPHHYMTASWSDRMDLLAGLLDTDGSVDGSGWEFSSSRKDLTLQVQKLCRSLGLRATFGERETACNGKRFTSYRLHINGTEIPTRLKKAARRKCSKNPRLQGFSVSCIGEGPYHGVVIDGDRKHLLADFSVVHNTIMVSEIMRRRPDRCLFLADARELVGQNADKFHQLTGEVAGVEMGTTTADLSSRVVVATVQSLGNRLDRYPRNHFGFLTFDEAHRNTLGAQAQKVINHFEGAQILGVTATPYRSDRRQLGEFYETIGAEIGLFELIRLGYLSRIMIKSVPLQGVDLRNIRTAYSSGEPDYNIRDLGAALEPHLVQAAEQLRDHASGRKTVVFLPLIETSIAFVEACRSIGLRACHVDGVDRSNLQRFVDGEFDIIANASLLSYGWDCPPVDCVYPLRPTKSLALFQQEVGRGTRIHPNKENLLVLDPLFLSDDHNLIRSARLIAKTQEQAKAIQESIDDGDVRDIEEVDEEATKKRESRLAEELKACAKKRARTVDAMDFFLSLDIHTLSDYEPEMKWEMKEMTVKQSEFLDRAGIDITSIHDAGMASRVIDTIMNRRNAGMATPKQVKLIRQYGYESPEKATFEEASAFINMVAGNGWRKLR